MSGIHQFVPMLHAGDAVGRHTAALQALLAERGFASEIYVELDDPETADRTRPAAAYPGEAAPGDVVVYQFATASDLAGLLAARPEALIVNYHNVTPPELFAPWDNTLARHQVRALGELAQLAGRAVLGVAVSEWNRADLVAAGYAATAVVPPLVDLPAAAPSGGGGGRPRHPGGRWLAVGRLAPNKSVEDILAALLLTRAGPDPLAELTVIGKPAVPAYAEALRSYAAELGIAAAVHFVGHVDDDALARAYAGADVLLVTSEHEGFCLPVVEAMARDLPVVAYRQGALPEVLGDAGVLVDEKDPATLTEAVRRLGADAGWRAAVVAAGRARLAALDVGRAGTALVDLCAAAHDGGPWPDSVAPRPVSGSDPPG
jgi:glycosyltransferase involved in cell wall biosynthesis